MVAGTLMQLTDTGLQDVYLTTTPKASTFKYEYMQYINFSNENVRLSFNDTVDFGKKFSCNIPTSSGHFLSKLYMHIKLPILTKTSGEYLSWCNTIGYSIFKNGIDLEIGGVKFETFYPTFADIYDCFTTNQEPGRDLLLLRSDTFVASKYNALKEQDLLIPLKFFFTKQYNLALPIFAMPSQSIKLVFHLREFIDCINYDGTTIPDIIPVITDASIYAEYSYIDTKYTSQFLNKKLEYLIEYTEQDAIETIPANTSIFSTKMSFNNPCKEIVLACTESANVEFNNYFNYSRIDNSTAIIKELAMYLDGKIRYDYTPEFFYRLVYPNIIHTQVPLEYVYSIPFSIMPEKNQPSGTLNMSKFQDVSFSIKMSANNPKCYLYIYAIMYNVLVIENGHASLKFMR